VSKTEPLVYKNSIKPLQRKLFHIVFLTIFLTFGTSVVYAQEIPKSNIPFPAKNQQIEPEKELNIAVPDTIKTDSIPKKKPLLESKIKRKAVDYEKIDQKKKLITLYNQAEVYYQDIELKSGIIVIDYQKNEIYAGRIKDSLGKYTQLPVFKQGANVVEPDSIRFNYKTKKALIWNSRTEQGEFKVKAAITKRENDSVYYMKGARFTTAKDIDNPEYYFQTDKVKFVPGKKVVIGLTNMVIADVPTPIALPFAYFPMTETSKSGIIMPTYNDSNLRGFSLQNGGYYFALSDSYDLAILGDYYTNGSYGLRFQSNYASRYKFSGNFNLRYENLVNSERGFPDYNRTTIYNIQWSHNQDTKANPNSRFSASVNLGSSQYFQQSINQINNGSQLNNTLNSSVSYSKTFNTVPQVNMSLTATHSQNTNTGTINMTLPTLQASVDRIFPFAPGDGIKKGVLKNINFQYNLNARNEFVTHDSLFFKPQMFRDAKIGFEHSIPLSTNFKVFKHFSATSSVNYKEVWYFKTINKEYIDAQNAVVDTEVPGFDAFRTYSFNTGIGTTIYGTFNFKKGKKIQAIRHVMRPNISYSYTPSFANFYDTYDPDGSGTIRKDYTRFEGGIYGAPGLNMSNNLNFTLNNTLEAKVTDKDSTKTEAKKIKLLNNLLFSTSYDMSADSLRLAPMRVSASTQLFKEKLDINFGTTLDPYAINNSGRRINTWNIDNGGSLFRMTSANITMNYSFSSQDADGKEKENKTGAQNGGRNDDLFGKNVDLSDRRESQFGDDENDNKVPNDFFKYKLPFDLTFAYSLTFSNNNRENKITGNSIMVSMNTDLTPKWKIGASTGYDFVQQGVTFTQLRFERDLLSWRMDFNWSPFGDQANWGFFIGIKSGVLSDIKWDKRNLPERVLR
jgi:lipopolysaccharide assembly outer membrane protein LptD (OstA)